MSWSLGDTYAHQFGVSSIPEVKIIPYSQEDLFIIVASDGIWEWISNEEAAEVVFANFTPLTPKLPTEALV